MYLLVPTDGMLKHRPQTEYIQESEIESTTSSTNSGSSVDRIWNQEISSYWQSNGSSGSHYVLITLKEPQVIQHIEVRRPRQNDGGFEPNQVELEVGSNVEALSSLGRHSLDTTDGEWCRCTNKQLSSNPVQVVKLWIRETGGSDCRVRGVRIVRATQSEADLIAHETLKLGLPVAYGATNEDAVVVGFKTATGKLQGEHGSSGNTWTDASLERHWKLSQLFASTELVVGMHRVRETLQLLVDDMCGRTMVNEQHNPRHVMLSGASGSGKRTIGRTICQLLSLIDSSFDAAMTEDYETISSQKPGSCAELESLLESQCGKLHSGHNQQSARKTVAHYRIDKDLDTDELVALNEKIAEHTCSEKCDVVILSGCTDRMNGLTPKISQFTKRAPLRIHLNDLTATELATVTLQLLQRSGYSMSSDTTMQASIGNALVSLIALLIHILLHDTHLVAHSLVA